MTWDEFVQDAKNVGNMVSPGKQIAQLIKDEEFRTRIGKFKCAACSTMISYRLWQVLERHHILGDRREPQHPCKCR